MPFLRGVMGLDKTPEQWYSAKDLFEMVQLLKEDIGTLRLELTATRQLVSQYNSLRSKLDDTQARVDAWEHEKEGKRSVARGICDWGGWIIAVLGWIVAVLALLWH